MRIPLPERLVAANQKYSSGAETPAEPKNAATVVLLRDHEAALEVYLLRRETTMAFAGGMCVFPGGGVDARDYEVDAAHWAGPDLATWAANLGTDEPTAAALVCAAVRETFEESGVLLAGPSATEIVPDTTDPQWEADRQRLEARELSLTEFLKERNLVLRSDLLRPWAGWLTPMFEPRRYRTWFFVAQLPAGQITRDVSSEAAAVTWLPALTAADQVEAFEILMLPPTYQTCLDVAQYGSVAGVLTAGESRRVSMFTPQVIEFGDGHTLSVPDWIEPVLTERESQVK